MTPQPPDYNAWKFWFDVLQLLGTCAIGLYVLWVNRGKVTAKKFKELERQVTERMPLSDHKDVEERRNTECRNHLSRTGELERTMERIGTEVRNMPSRQEMAVLSHDINGLTNKLGQVEGRLNGLNRVADLINEFLINQGGKK